MDFFVEQAPTDQAVHALVRGKYGERARILSRREVWSGGLLGLFRKRAVEVTGYYSHGPARIRPSTPETMETERRKILSTVRGDEGDRTRSVAETPTGGTGGSLSDVMRELRALRESVGGGDTRRDEPEGLVQLRSVLDENEFSSAYTGEIVERAKRELSYDGLAQWDALGARVLEWISDNISTFPWDEHAATPRVVVLIGPTGVGKTTTIAKLAAMYGAVADPVRRVRMITIDSYRIGALQQIQKYGEIMGLPVAAVETKEEMRRQISLAQDDDFVFVDTIGKSPRDFGKLAEVHELVSEARGEVHLAVSATTKLADMREIFRQFEPFAYSGVIFTKMDETSNVGNLLSVLRETRKSVSFLTDGQSVPQDLERAQVASFTKRLHGFARARSAVVEDVVSMS